MKADNENCLGIVFDFLAAFLLALLIILCAFGAGYEIMNLIRNGNSCIP